MKSQKISFQTLALLNLFGTPVALSISIPGAHAEGWFCTDESSRREGNTWTVCGIGEDEKEARSRSIALENATEEFKNLCKLSSDCRGHDYSLKPGRTECRHLEEGVPGHGLVRCVRAVEFVVGDKKSDEEEEAPEMEPETDDPKEKKALLPNPMNAPWTFDIWFGYMPPPLETAELTSGPFLISVGIERRLFKRLGLSLGMSYFTNAAEPDEYSGVDPEIGPGFEGTAWLATLPIYLSRDATQSWFIAPEGGLVDHTYITAPANPDYGSDFLADPYVITRTRGSASVLGAQFGYRASNPGGGYSFRVGYRTFNPSSGPAMRGVPFGEFAIFLRF
jgi:hypothetical protein